MIIFLHILYPLTSAFSLSACLSFTSLSWRSDLRSAWPLLCAVTWHIQWPLWAIVGHCGPLWAIVGHAGYSQGIPPKIPKGFLLRKLPEAYFYKTPGCRFHDFHMISMISFCFGSIALNGVE